MATYSVNLETVNLQLLTDSVLQNEEIIELLLLFCSCESIQPYREHIRILRDKYDVSLEMRRVESQILSLRDKFKLRQAKNFFSAIDDQTFTSMIYEVVNDYQNDPSASLYAQTLELIFGVTPDADFAKDLVNFIDHSELDGPGILAIIRRYTQVFETMSEYAPAPKYIKQFDIDIEKLPQIEEKGITGDYPTELIADHILYELDNYDVYLEEDEEGSNKAAIIDKLNNMPASVRNQFISCLKISSHQLEEIRDNKDIFRIYGPVNPYQDVDYSELRDEEGNLDPNIIYGGARMFTDMSLEYDYDNDLPVDHWFQGHCLECSYRIKYLHQAVREPLISGGWRGCFCSWKCVRRYIELYNGDNDEAEDNVGVLQVALTQEYEKLMDEYGIADREFEEEEEPEQDDDSQKVKEDPDAINALMNQIPPLPSQSLPILTILPIDYGEGAEST